MKLARVFTALAGLAAVRAAVNLSDFPSCSLECLTEAIAKTNCGLTDYACQCGAAKTEITNDATPCIKSACDAADQTSAVLAASSNCAQFASSTGSSKATSTGSGSSSASATSSSASGSTAATGTAASATTNAAPIATIMPRIAGAVGAVAVGMLAL